MKNKSLDEKILSRLNLMAAFVAIFVSIVTLINIYQAFMSASEVNTLKKVDESNRLMTNIALAATPEIKLNAIDEAIDFDKENAELYYYRAITYYNMAQEEQGQKSFYSMNSNNSNSFEIYKNDEKLDYAYEDCNSALKYDDNKFEVYYLQGQISFDRENFSDAYDKFIKCYKNKNKLVADNSHGYLQGYIGISSYRLQKYDECIKYLEELTDLQKSYWDNSQFKLEQTMNYMIANSYEVLGTSQNNANYLKEALNCYEKILRTSYVEEHINVCDKIIELCDKIQDGSKKEYYKTVRSYIEQNNGALPDSYLENNK